MQKNILTIAFFLVLTATLIGWPLLALSATVTFDADTDIYLSGSGYTITVVNGSTCAEMEVGTTSVTFTIDGTVTLRSTERRWLGDNTDCSRGDYSERIITDSDGASVTVTPSSTICGSTVSTSGGGGGAPSNVPTTPTVSVPTTTTGSVTATASGGGKTTLTTAENTTAQVELPANAVSASTEVKVTTESTTEVVASRPVPSGKNAVGNYVYNYTATAAGQAVSTFSKEVTITITYTDTQVAGLKESSLKIYYWDGTQWLALISTVNTANNKVTADSTHFTYFIILGDPEEPSERAKPEDYGLKEGDLIRAVGDFDIFIINEHGYKRLFLNPVIFEMYGHLGSWDDVISVAPSTRDAFITSTHYRYVDEDKVYHLEVTGEDTGILQWINMTGEDFLAQGGESLAIFTINKSELDWYPKGADKTSL